MNLLNLKLINLKFNSAKHTYTLDGKWIPSVTGILGVLPKDWLAPWASKMACESLSGNLKPDTKYTKEEIATMLESARSAHRIRKEVAGKTGTDVHALIADYIEGKEIVLSKDEETLNAWKQFNLWQEKISPKWLASEVLLASPTLQVAGTCDAVARIGNKLVVIDWKSSKAVSPEYAVQLAAYQYMLTELGCPTPDQRIILRLPKEGGDYEEVVVKSKYEDDMEIFLAAMKIYPWHKENQKAYNQSR